MFFWKYISYEGYLLVIYWVGAVLSIFGSFLIAPGVKGAVSHVTNLNPHQVPKSNFVEEGFPCLLRTFAVCYILLMITMFVLHHFYGRNLLEIVGGLLGAGALIALSHLHNPSGHEKDIRYERRLVGSGGFIGIATKKDVVESRSKLTWEEHVRLIRTIIQVVMLLIAMIVVYVYLKISPLLFVLPSVFVVYWILRAKLK
jgi:hypothetical protein